jgi:hypothetical protein
MIHAIRRAVRAACYLCVGDGHVDGMTCRRCGGSGTEPGT